MLDTEKLIVLRAVAANGSIAAAARELGYTRSAVSQQMSALERSAGVSLLIRGGNTVTLTPLGERLLEHTERILVELRAAEATLRQSDGVAGRIRIGVPFREGPAIMSTALTSIRKRYPRLEITLRSVTDLHGAEEVRRGQLDMVILSTFGASPPLPETGLRHWVLSRDPLLLCAPTKHPLAALDSCAVEQLRDEPWVVCQDNPLGTLVLGLCTAAGFRPDDRGDRPGHRHGARPGRRRVGGDHRARPHACSVRERHPASAARRRRRPALQRDDLPRRRAGPSRGGRRGGRRPQDGLWLLLPRLTS